MDTEAGSKKKWDNKYFFKLKGFATSILVLVVISSGYLFTKYSTLFTLTVVVDRYVHVL